MSLIVGLDEVGRGCIAGPVIAAAVVFPDGTTPVEGLADSKQLSPDKRRRLVGAIQNSAVAWAIGRAEVAEIDRLNILQASLLAMRRAFAGLAIEPDRALVDGNHCPVLPCPSQAVIGGDRRIPSISAASILAKVFRDREMEVLDSLLPGYGLAEHKGYPTAAHRSALEKLAPSPLHRRSFGPVRRLLEGSAPDLIPFFTR